MEKKSEVNADLSQQKEPVKKTLDQQRDEENARAMLLGLSLFLQRG